MRHCSKIFLLLFTLLFSYIAQASFVVKSIRVVGSQQIPASTVLNYLPVHVGDTVDENNTPGILQALYDSGLFQHVYLSQDDNTLVVHVDESGGIGHITITGNKKIKKEEIYKLLKENDIVSGSLLSHERIQNFREQLLEQYAAMGRYNATVNVKTVQKGGRAVGLNIVIDEGNVAKVREIRFVGNHAYSSFRLKQKFVLTTFRPWAFITQSNQYTKPKLQVSLENLKNFYLDHGYARYRIDSAHVSLTPDKKGIVIIVTMTEGNIYKFSGYDLQGNLILPRETLDKSVTIRRGRRFSRQEILNTEEALGTAIGDKGYAFVQVRPDPLINDETREVFIIYHITPGPRVYVRRISFSGNTMTADYVLRHSVVQPEGGLVSVSKIRASIRHLNLLGFFKSVDVKTTPVPGTHDQVDIEYLVVEQPPGQATVSIGYARGGGGLTYGAGINQPNFLGTGKTVGVNFNRSRYVTSLGFNYYNPYFTATGIGRGIAAQYQKTSPDALNLARYAFNTLGGSLFWNIPISARNSIHVGAGVNRVQVELNPFPSKELATFVNTYGSNFGQVDLTASWTYQGLDRGLFPTRGFYNTLGSELSAPASSGKLQYYKFSYTASYFLPLVRSNAFILEIAGGAGYGNGYGAQNGLPFFENYFAGGLSSGQVRGFENGSLGPKDSQGNPLGGNELLYANTMLILPNFISDDVRTGLFLDAGNVYQSNSDLYTFGSGPIRYSYGVGVQWRSPMGLISVSYGVPINIKPGDRAEHFQFTMGATF
ncbi:MAG: outer membrane protein assembly factor BamA [Gammaproteobacteria bacterium]